jgi:D-threo-aldose 1-dehydrogenase
MKRHLIGSTDVAVTELGLGTAQLGDLYVAMTPEDATHIVDAAWNGGIRYFDTAPHYGLGLAERRLGDALHERPRDEYVISTKVGRLIVPGDDGPERRWDFTASGIERSLTESLTRLHLDRVDIALIHDPQEHLTDALENAYPALERLRSAGMVRAIGVGSGNLEALTAFARDTDIDVMMIAGRLTLLEQPALTDLVPLCLENGISILNAGVFNSGLLATPEPSAESKYEYSAAPAARLRKATLLARLATQHGTTLPHAALRFAAEQQGVASVVVGADTAAQIQQNIHDLHEDRPLDDLWRELASLALLSSPAPRSPFTI